MNFFSSAPKTAPLTAEEEQDIDAVDDNLRKQYKYKYYKEEVVSVLKSFDQSKEWADLIRCLQRLNKVLKKYPQFPLMPEKLTVAKRLSQCLNAALPGGVHLKTLETYDEIFKHIKEKRLARDLHIYSAGLITLYPFASIQIKPVILDLIQAYYLPLGKALLPCLSGLVISLLSGLEEEGSDIYQRSLRTLDKICDVTDTVLFFRSLWKGIVSTPKNRVASYNYVNVYLKRNKTIEPDSPFFGGSKPLMVEAIMRSLDDDSLMVQRGVLEILSSCLTMGSNLLDHENMVLVLSKALKLLDKKEVSINRRLYQWLFNGGEFDRTFFLETTMPRLQDAFKILFNRDNLINSLRTNDSDSEEDDEELQQRSDPALRDPVKPYRVLIALLERIPETSVADQLVAGIIEDIMWYAQSYIDCKDVYVQPAQEKVVDATIDFFTKTVPDKQLWWNTLISLINKQDMRTFELIGDIFSIMYDKDLSIANRVPIMLMELLKALNTAVSVETPNPVMVETILLLSINLFSKLPTESVFDDEDEEEAHTPRSVEEQIKLLQDILAQIESFLETVTERIISVFNIHEKHSIEREQFVEVYKSTCTFLTILMSRMTELSAAPLSKQQVPIMVKSLYNCSMIDDPLINIFAIETFLGLLSNPGIDRQTQRTIITGQSSMRVTSPTTPTSESPSQYLRNITVKLWNLLVPEYGQVHYEAVKLLVEIHSLNKAVCNAIVSDAMLDAQSKVEGHRRFSIVWKLIDDLNIKQRVFDDGLFLMLDSMRSEDSSLRLVGRSWLLNGLNNVNRLLDPLFETVVDREVVKKETQQESANDSVRVADTPFDEHRSKYVLTLWHSMLEVAPKRFIQKCMQLDLSSNVLLNYQKHIRMFFRQKQQKRQSQQVTDVYPTSMPSTLVPTDTRNDYLSLLVTTCIYLMECGVSLEATEQNALRESIRISSVILLRNILSNGKDFKRITDVALSLSECILAHLQISIKTKDPVYQVELLGTVYTLLAHMDSHAGKIAPPHNTIGSGPIHGHIHDVNELENGNDKESVIRVSTIQSPNFLPTLLTGLTQASRAQISSLHHSFALLNYWIDYIVSFLPFMRTLLPNYVSRMVPHLCGIAREMALDGIDSLRGQSIKVLVGGLKHFLNYCILDSPVKQSEDPTAVVLQFSEKNQSQPLGPKNQKEGGWSAFTSFMKDVFTADTDQQNAKTTSPAQEAQRVMMLEIPSVLGTLTVVWKALRTPFGISHSKKHMQYVERKPTVGNVHYGSLHTKQAIEKSIIDFVDPLLLKYPYQLMASITVLWQLLHPESMTSVATVEHELDAHLIDMLNNADSATPDHVATSLIDVILGIQKSITTPGAPVTATVTTIAPEANTTQAQTPQPQPEQKVVSGIPHSSSTGSIQSLSEEQEESATVDQRITSTGLLECVGVNFLNVYLHKCILTENSTKILSKVIQMIQDLITNQDPLVLGGIFKTLYRLLSRWPSAGEEIKKLRTTLKDTTAKLIDATCNACSREMSLRKQILTKKLNEAAKANSKLTARERDQIVHNYVCGEDPSLRVLESLASHHSFTSVLEIVYRVGPNMENQDRDRVQNVVSSAVGILCGILKHHTIDNCLRITRVMRLVSTLKRLPPHALRHARKDLWEAFNDQQFFRCEHESLRDWRIVMRGMLMASGHHSSAPLTSSSQPPSAISSTISLSGVTDRVTDMFPNRITDRLTNNLLTNTITTTGTILADTFGSQDNPLKSAALLADLLQRFNATPSIFSSRDSEAANRAKLLKRVAFLIYTGSRDDYYQHYPPILEKMVESLKVSVGSMQSYHQLMSSALLLMRVLICRSSQQNLGLFWPTIITELIRVFGGDYASENGGKRDPLVTIEALKFLDYATVVLPESFQIYKWMFFSDKSETPRQLFIPFMDLFKSSTVETTYLTERSNSKRKPIITKPSYDYLRWEVTGKSEDIDATEESINDLARQLAVRAEQMDLSPSSVGKDCDIEFIDNLLEMDFVELRSEELRQLSNENVQERAEDHKEDSEEAWIVVSVK